MSVLAWILGFSYGQASIFTKADFPWPILPIATKAFLGLIKAFGSIFGGLIIFYL